MENNINKVKTIEELEQINNAEDAAKLIKELEDTQIAADSQIPHLNRAQRRTLTKKLGKTGRAKADLIMDTTKKINYIDLIQKLRELNKKRENEENEATQNGNSSI